MVRTQEALRGPVVALYAAGTAWQYQGSIMEKVAHWRHLSLPSGVRGFVAVRNCARIGQLVYAVVGKVRAWWRVADCSNPRDVPSQTRKHSVIEVSGWEAIRQGWDTYRLGGPGHTTAVLLAFRAYRARDW